jgi:galactitol-specific phosphotransferase system IIB component
MKTISLLILFSLLLPEFSAKAETPSRVASLYSIDTTERLENIYILKKSLKELNIQVSVLDTALIEAKKKRNHKKIYVTTRKISDAITALTILGSAIATYHFNNEMRIIKIASFIGGLSTSISVLSSLLADLSTDEAEALKNKLDDLATIIKATNVNLNHEIGILCHSEPSNQMCH